jgi:predicted SpoU family rRNA methylase
MISWEKMVGRKKPAYNSHVGLTMRAPGGDVVVVKAQSAFYVSEGGLGMGYDDDQGWVLKLTARPAGQNEIATFLAREARASRW